MLFTTVMTTGRKHQSAVGRSRPRDRPWLHRPAL
jgi:hypothetical protein